MGIDGNMLLSQWLRVFLMNTIQSYGIITFGYINFMETGMMFFGLKLPYVYVNGSYIVIADPMIHGKILSSQLPICPDFSKYT